MYKTWTVEFTSKAVKQADKLPVRVREALHALVKDLQSYGPSLGLLSKNWANFSPLKGRELPKGAYHCHLKKGKPTYVAYWRIENKEIKIIEVFYVGTHENAPY